MRQMVLHTSFYLLAVMAATLVAHDAQAKQLCPIGSAKVYLEVDA